METDRANVLDVVYFVRYGAERIPKSVNDRAVFLEELRTYRQTLVAQGLPTITAAALRGWLLGARQAVPKRSAAMAFLHGYLQWIEQSRRSEFRSDIRRREEYENLLAYLKSFEVSADASRFERDVADAQSHGRLDELRLDQPFVARVRRILVSAARNRKRSDPYDLFEGGSRSSLRETSYYIVYRYSTNGENVMKSFLVIERPAAEERSFSSFNHFSRGIVRSYEQKGKRIFRECEGLALPFERSFYLLGYNYNVRARENISEAAYQELRLRARQHPDGIGLIAIEYEDVAKSNGLITGLTLTMAGGNQPVAARIALLHLGTKTSLGLDVWDSQVVPWEGPEHEAGSDLQKTLDRITALGCKDFGVAVAAAFERANAGSAGAELFSKILPLINNAPAWEIITRKSSASLHAYSVLARGALETYGLDRPRD